jgi:hypothetical protein
MLLSDTATGGEQVVWPGASVHELSVAPTNVDAFWISTGTIRSAIWEVVVTVDDSEQGNGVGWMDPSLNK